MLSRLSPSLSTALGLVSTTALAALTLGLAACGQRLTYEGPELSAFEQRQHARCVSLLRSAWQGAPVRSTSAERGVSGLDYVWVNAHVDDDEDDIERRSAKGTQHAGHCQFDHGGEVVHVHSYALEAPVAQSEQAPSRTDDAGSYRYFTASISDSGLASGPSTIATR